VRIEPGGTPAPCSRMPLPHGPGRSRRTISSVKSGVLYHLSYRPRGSSSQGVPDPDLNATGPRRSPVVWVAVASTRYPFFNMTVADRVFALPAAGAKVTETFTLTWP